MPKGKQGFQKGHPKFTDKGEFKKGHKTWCKGLKGIHLSPKTEFKKGQPSVFKGKKRPNMTNENHPRWRGDKVCYFALHTWIKRHRGSPQVCKHCGITAKQKRLSWANIDHKYRRVLDNYISLCSSCHKKYDKNLPKSLLWFQTS